MGEQSEIQKLKQRVKELELQIKNENEKSSFNRLFNKSTDPILIIDDDVFIDCNDATIEFLKYTSKKDIIGKRPEKLSPEYQPDGQISTVKAKELIKTALKSGSNRFEWVHLLNGGEERWVDVSLTHIPEQGINRVYTIWRNIHERKKAEIALKESEEKFKVLTLASPSGIYLTDSNGDCTYANPYWLKMAGMKLKDVLGSGWIRVIHPDDRKSVKDNWYKMVQAHGEWGFEYRFLNKDGKVTWVYGTAAEILDDSDTIIGYVGVNIDITQKIEMEEELKKYREQLEELVDKRTKKLEEKNQELENFNQLFMGREFRIKELKDRIHILESKLKL